MLSRDLALSFRFSALLLPVICFVPLRRKALQALQRVPSSIAFEEIVLPLFAIALSLACAVASASQALWAYFAATCLVLLAASVWLWRAFPHEARGVKPAYETREWMAVALPIMIGNVAQVVINRAGLLILGAMADMESVGFFSAATRRANLNVFVLGAVNTIAAPMLAAAFHGGRPEQFRLLMRKAMLWSVLGSLPLFVFMMIWPGWLLHFFGPRFTGAAALLRILALGQFIHAATGPVGFGLIMSDREVSFAASTTVVAGLTIVASVVLIPLYGAVGAAAVGAGGVALMSGWQYLLSRRIGR
jgi:O-antigen/teichoic acid export membrane protein